MAICRPPPIAAIAHPCTLLARALATASNARRLASSGPIFTKGYGAEEVRPNLTILDGGGLLLPLLLLLVLVLLENEPDDDEGMENPVLGEEEHREEKEEEE
mmetsp:Transcript_34072/g.70352  ORF Transcript_34072/g.70352 Transcript_34072/m.70352 type:complete len:102 (-) Transcript_34072:545-850(-)